MVEKGLNPYRAGKESILVVKNSKSDLREIISKLISVSDLSRGMASKIIKKVGKDREQYIVIKHNKPEAVILSIEDYLELMDAKEDLELIQLSESRIKNYVSEDTISHESVLSKYNISEENLDELIDSVEIE